MIDTSGTLERHEAFWNRRSTDRPLLRIRRNRAPLTNTDIEPEMLDAELLCPLPVGRLVPDDLFRTECPFPKIPWMEAICGCGIHAGADEAMWAKPVIESDDAPVPPFRTDGSNPWLRKLLELTRRLLDACDGSYLVTQTLQRGPSDILSALLGDVRMGLWFYDQPDRIHEILCLAADAFIAVTKSQYALIPPFHGGWALWNYGLWAPGSVTRIQTDASVQISRQMYERFILPHERRIMAAFDYSLMDLHSGGTLALRDPLLEEPGLNAISVTLDPYESCPSIADLLPVFLRILERKALLVYGQITAEQLTLLTESLPPRGLCLNVSIKGEEP